MQQDFKLIIFIVVFVLGCVSVFFLKNLPSLWLCVSIFIFVLVSAGIWIVYRKLKKTYTAVDYSILISFSFSMGFLCVDYKAHMVTRWHLPTTAIQRPMSIEGRIISLPKETAFGESFEFKMNDTNAIINLTWHGNHPQLFVGDMWHFIVKLKPPHSLHNFIGFNYSLWQFINGIRASGYVVTRYPSQLIAHHILAMPIDRLRQYIQHIIQAGIPNSELAAILSALTVGSRTLLQKPAWQVFQNTGTSHLVAISGLHVGFVSMSFYSIAFLFRYLWPRLLLRFARPHLGIFISLFGIGLYSFISGFSVPTQRATIMILLFMLSTFLRRMISVWRRLLFSFFIIILFDPFALFSESLWLSFFAVGIMSYGNGAYLNRPQKRWIKGLRLQMIVFFGLLPLTIYCFQQLSLVSFFANIIAIPWIGLIVVPSCLLSTLLGICNVWLGEACFYVTSILLIPLWKYLNVLAHLSHAVWHYTMHSPMIFVTSTVAIFLFLAPRSWVGRWTAILWSMPLFFPRIAMPADGTIWITVLDVGQGLASVVQTAHHTMIYDTGPKYGSDFDAGADIVVPYLRWKNISTVNCLMISHGDNDHSGGAASIRANVSVQKTLSSIISRFPTASFCMAGQEWVWEHVHFQVLAPPNGMPYEGNNSSCVLKITTQSGASILLSGDIEQPTEFWLLHHAIADLPATLLIAPHHGSHTSSTTDFVKSVHPYYVLFSTGYYNRYQFPNAAVVNRYRKSGALVLNTAEQGAITFHLSSTDKITFQIAHQRNYFWQ